MIDERELHAALTDRRDMPRFAPAEAASSAEIRSVPITSSRSRQAGESVAAARTALRTPDRPDGRWVPASAFEFLGTVDGLVGSFPAGGFESCRAYRSPRPLPSARPRALLAKRVADIVLAVVGLLLAAPLALAIALAVKVGSRGPVLFAQERVGRDGRSFRILKFRTMKHGTHDEVLADAGLRASYELNDFKLPADDCRITPLGRLLRKSSLDEIPQLVNVLLGQMSVVGIRPLLAAELRTRSEYDQALYLQMRPGLTGRWQTEGRSSVVGDDRLRLDRSYVTGWTLWGDVRIVARTPFAVLRTANAR